MNHDDHDDDSLGRIDLHAWRVPPVASGDRAALLSRVLSPSISPKRSRMTWMLAALAIANVVLASLLVIIISRPSPVQNTTVIQPAGGGSVDAQTAEILRRLAEEQLQLEGKLTEVQQLRTLVEQLSEKVRQCEAEHTMTTKRHDPAPHPVVPVDPFRTDPVDPVVPVDPFQTDPVAPADAGCDEVSCVLQNYPNGCCTKYKKGSPPVAKSPLPESLDRESIQTAIVAVKGRVAACSQQSPVHGNVKLHVVVEPKGSVRSVTVEKAPDAVLARCVAAVVQKATFAKTQLGGSFSYPFVF